MPLDSTNWSRTETETKPDLSKPSLEGLSWLLRHLPADHEWDFTAIGGPKPNWCGSAGCAIGLYETVWPGYAAIGEELGIDGEIGGNFFRRSAYPVPDNKVTPTMVADRIDAYLASRSK